jgi:hypothetical protein
LKHALIFGGGSKLGLELSNLISDDYKLTVITGSKVDISNATVEFVDWNTLDLATLDRILHPVLTSDDTLDLIIFNQNSKSGPSDPSFFDHQNLTYLYNNWLYGFRSDCMLPYYVIYKLKSKIQNNTKICWMLTSLINEYIQLSLTNHASYRGIKLTNYFIMAAFAQGNKENQGIYFGIDPGHTTEETQKDKAEKINLFLKQIDKETNGQVFNIDNSNYWAPLAPVAHTGPI